MEEYAWELKLPHKKKTLGRKIEINKGDAGAYLLDPVKFCNNMIQLATFPFRFSLCLNCNQIRAESRNNCLVRKIRLCSVYVQHCAWVSL